MNGGGSSINGMLGPSSTAGGSSYINSTALEYAEQEEVKGPEAQ